MDISRRSFLAFFVGGTTLLIIAVMVYNSFQIIPYLCFSYNNSTGSIIDLRDNALNSGLRLGDKIRLVNGVDFKEAQADLTRGIFAGVKGGDHLTILVDRNGGPVWVEYTVPTWGKDEFFNRLFNTWLVGGIFWIFGVLTFLLVRPRDDRWLLLCLFYFILGAWLVTGVTQSMSYDWYSPLITRALSWILLVVGLHLHWLFPYTLSPLPRKIIFSHYGAAGILACLELFDYTPNNLYFVPIIALVVGSTILLGWHMRQRDSRAALRLPFFSFIVILIINITLPYIGSVLEPRIANGGVLLLALLPTAYFHTLYRHRPSGMVTRDSRWMIMVTYSALLAYVILGLAAGIIFYISDPYEQVIWLTVMAICAAWMGAAFSRAYYRWFEKALLKVSLSAEELVRAASLRLAASQGAGEVIALIQNDVLPSLMIRQAALLWFDSPDRFRIQPAYQDLLLHGVEASQLPAPEITPQLLQSDGRLMEPQDQEWVRLALPISYQAQPVGLALFGQRDPDDTYFAADIDTLRALMAQVGLAIINSTLTESILNLQQKDIQRREEERRRLARDLHDDVLQQMTLIFRSLEDRPPQFEAAYYSAATRIRAIIGRLQPVLLEQAGLFVGLDDLMDDLRQKSQDIGGPQVIFEIARSEIRYNFDTELNLYRIVQQASFNALDHANARHLFITGELQPDYVRLQVKDDGNGFSTADKLDVPYLLVRKRYGILGMVERARLINAALSIQAIPGQGATVMVEWRQSPGYGSQKK